MENGEEKFLGLSRLAHDSLANRQQYEWRVNFSLWTAIGLTVYASVTNKLVIFRSDCGGWMWLGILVVTYVGFLALVTRGHKIDRSFKHYYMDMAEGINGTKRPETKNSPWYVTIGWPLTQLIFTAAIGWLALQLLLGVTDPTRRQPSTNAAQAQEMGK